MEVDYLNTVLRTVRGAGNFLLISRAVILGEYNQIRTELFKWIGLLGHQVFHWPTRKLSRYDPSWWTTTSFMINCFSYQSYSTSMDWHRRTVRFASLMELSRVAPDKHRTVLPGNHRVLQLKNNTHRCSLSKATTSAGDLKTSDGGRVSSFCGDSARMCV